MGLGLDYNEDLMLKLASRIGGNHIFVEDVEQLANIFNEEFKISGRDKESKKRINGD